ncbi:hypothetical protein FQA39_LY00875 [Lamprigera yunnana]|nr:hypothetical protein FQA39_LY00875 [Lamprigera yunnana]
MLLNQIIYYLNKSKSKWISVGLYYPFEFASVVKIFGRSKQYVIFKEEDWIQFHEQRENINKYFQTCDMMWKPRQIGSKILTFEMIKKKKILKIENMCENKVCLGWESVSEKYSLLKRCGCCMQNSIGPKATDLKSAAEPLYENLGALEFDADHEAIYGMEKYYTVEQCEQLRDKYKIGRKCLKDRLSKIELQHFLDTINKYISNSDTSDEEEYKAVEQNGEGSDTTKEEESKKSKGAGITKPVS